MAITTRQTNLLVNQNWASVYQTFSNADFQSYDFETLRKTMIDYLRTYYPEDFNDFTESSEYIALIDMIAFLGQSLAFRTDLNARENFIDTAERRDSILKLARLISYNPKRNTCASGFLKFDSVTTTENVTDSNGLNLSNLIINWNDSTNPDWQEQFNTILNASLVSTQMVGKPGNSQVIGGVKHDEYSINLVQNVIPTYAFTSQVEGNTMNFEAVSATSIGQSYVYEPAPVPNGQFIVLNKNDNLGNNSNNTGFFVYFKQGTLGKTNFNLQQSLPNRTVSVNFNNINNTDVWLYELDANGKPSTPWSSVPAIAGINVIYNQSTERNLFQINSRADDQIDLVFGDGSFSNVPSGNFSLYYRTSNGLTYKITPDEMQSITIPINYVSRSNRVETLTIRASLHQTVSNASSRELVNDIRSKAPQQYYTQNRMVTGEDYNIFPYTNFDTILKVKAVNRTSSGISRYLDVIDATGKYSSTNIFCDDGWLYKENPNVSQTFTFTSVNDINSAIYNKVVPILSSKEVMHFYFENFPRYSPTNISWSQTATGSNTSSGVFVNNYNVVQNIGMLTNNMMKYITVGSMMKFTAGAGKYFNGQNQIVVGTPQHENDRTYIYATVVATLGNNSVRLSENIPTAAVLDSIIPTFQNDITTNKTLTTQIVNLVKSYKNFGIRYDVDSKKWVIIQPQDLNMGAFSLANQGDTSSSALDSSWIVSFSYNGSTYTITNRSTRYIFESLNQTRFYFDPKTKVYDSKNGTTIRDTIKVLRINTAPDSANPIGTEQNWNICNPVIDQDGYLNNTKVYVTFADTNNDGLPNDPDTFVNIVQPSVNPTYKLVFFNVTSTQDNFLVQTPIDNKLVVVDYGTYSQIAANQTLYSDGQLFYATTEKKFYILNVDQNNTITITETTDYVAETGRQYLKFQYLHNSAADRRIDPSPNNIMDLYIITKTYSEDYRAWLADTTQTLVEPALPTPDELQTSYNTGSMALSNYKAISDTIVFNAGVYKPVFGSKADNTLQATFKVVKNPNVIVSDSEIKTSVIAAINQYFSPDNWDFGETFYFSELSTYLHNALAPNIASIILVPTNGTTAFGNLMQINANPYEIIVSAATVDNVEIISAITAAQIQ